MIKQFFIFWIALALLSCQKHQKFDKAKWVEVADLMTFPHRNSMIDDLTNNYQLKGKSYSEIVDLLGQPQGRGDNLLQIFYDIDVDYGSDIDPIYTKTLSIQFDKDSIARLFEVKEWKK